MHFAQSRVVCFFFSSRRRHTRCGRDWSSDVCSSDLRAPTCRRSTMVALIAVVRARAPRGAGSGYSFTIGCATALAVLVLLWLLWLVVSSLRSDVPPEPAAPTVTSRAAPVLVATTQALPPPTPPPPPPTSTPPPPTP